MKPIRILPISVFAALTSVLAGGVLAQEAFQQTASFDRFLVPVPSHPADQSATLLPDGRWLLVGASGVLHGKSVQVMDAPVSVGLPTIVHDSFDLIEPRSGHTATLLPDGKVFVFGGMTSNGKSFAGAELIDPDGHTVVALPETGLTPRNHHTATLLTNGLVLIAGGTDESGSPVELAELYNPKTQRAEPIVAAMETARSFHQAALLANGKGLVWGGTDAQGKAPAHGELYDPKSSAFSGVDWWDTTALPAKELIAIAPQVAESIPQDGAHDVALDAQIALRFTEPLKVQSITDKSFTIVGPSGAIAGKAVPAESGMLAFFTPSIELRPDTTYTIFLNGVTDTLGRDLPFSSVSFKTQRILALPNAAGGKGYIDIKITKPTPAAVVTSKVAASKVGVVAVNKGLPRDADKPKKDEDPADDDSEDWNPDEKNRHGQWRVLGLPKDPVFHPASLLVSKMAAAVGVTGLTGQIARLNGRPLAGVTVSVGSKVGVTDANGHFLIAGLADGLQTVKVDGTTALNGGRHYTKHFMQVQTVKGQTTAMPNTIYLPRVDPASEVNIASPADREIVLTHPSMPGLEVRIPKGVVLREYDGKIVTKLSITPIPVDRAPYPAPIDFSVYFTLQPGGAFVDGDPNKAVKIIYPNYQGLPAGTTVNFWNYDPNGDGWKVYGHGTVSKDGKTVIPDKSVGFRNVMTFGYGIGGGGSLMPAAKGPVTCGVCAADPVDLATGLFTHTVTDMSIPDAMPINLTRTYRQNDSISRPFGYGTSLSYLMYLCPPASGGTTCPAASSTGPLDLILPDSGRVHFAYQSGGISSHDGVWTNTDSASPYHGAKLTQQSSGAFNFILTTRDGTVMTFAPHAPNQLLSIADRNGNTVSLTLSGGQMGNVTQITSPNGRYIQLSYDGSNRIYLATDNIGRTVNYTYDSSGRLWKVSDMNQKTETYGYTDSADPYRMTTITDRRTNLVTQNVYDSAGRLHQQTLADGTYWLFDYQLDGTNTYINQTTVTDPRTYKTQYTFNASGYTTQEVMAVGQPEQQTYTFSRDATNLVQSMTDALSRVTKYSYDAYGDILSVTRLYGTSSAETDSFTYDPNYRQLASHTDALNHTTTFNPDGAGNLASVVDALNHTTTIKNNGQGLPTQITDALGHMSVVGYQQADVSGVTDPLNRSMSVFTDGVGRRRSMTDPMGYRALYAYDNMNRVLQVIDPQNGMTVMTYDENGNLRTVVDPRQVGTHTYTYDARNRLYTYTDPLNATETYLYDGLNNLVQKTDRKGQITKYQYDALNRVKLITYQDSSTIQIGWDAGNRPKQAVDSTNGTVSWTFDNLNRLTLETTPQGSVSYPVYDAADRLKQMVVNGGSAINYTYDNANRMTNVAQGSANVVIGYDNANRRSSVTLPNGVSMTYGYDDPGSDLQSITYASGSTSLGSITYGYDSNGRINSRASSIDSTGASTATAATTFNAANQLAQLGNTNLTYDANGSLTYDGINTYTWNARNQLTGISGAVNASFSYDAMGRRQSRNVNGNSTSFIYDGINLVQEKSGSTVIASYLTGRGVDETFSRTDSNGTQSYLTDILGSTVGLSGSSGSTATGYNYDAYGNTATSGTVSVNPIQYAGRENDGTGLYYNRARYYSPSLSRFISQDPIGLAGGNNMYAYVGGNPINNLDPNGLRDVNVYIWRSEGLSVGHVMVTEADSNQVILSQFPSNGLPWGRNQTKDFDSTMVAEGRPPSEVWKIKVPNDDAFDKASARERALRIWSMSPSDSTTQCSIAASRALKAGGVGITTMTNGTLMPGYFANNLQSHSGGDMQRR